MAGKKTKTRQKRRDKRARQSQKAAAPAEMANAELREDSKEGGPTAEIEESEEEQMWLQEGQRPPINLGRKVSDMVWVEKSGS